MTPVNPIRPRDIAWSVLVALMLAAGAAAVLATPVAAAGGCVYTIDGQDLDAASSPDRAIKVSNDQTIVLTATGPGPLGQLHIAAWFWPTRSRCRSRPHDRQYLDRDRRSGRTTGRRPGPVPDRDQQGPGRLSSVHGLAPDLGRQPVPDRARCHRDGDGGGRVDRDRRGPARGAGRSRWHDPRCDRRRPYRARSAHRGPASWSRAGRRPVRRGLDGATGCRGGDGDAGGREGLRAGRAECGAAQLRIATADFRRRATAARAAVARGTTDERRRRASAGRRRRVTTADERRGATTRRSRRRATGGHRRRSTPRVVRPSRRTGRRRGVDAVRPRCRACCRAGHRRRRGPDRPTSLEPWRRTP